MRTDLVTAHQTIQGPYRGHTDVEAIQEPYRFLIQDPPKVLIQGPYMVATGYRGSPYYSHYSVSGMRSIMMKRLENVLNHPHFTRLWHVEQWNYGTT